jgi:metal-dependent amidase/aminoacylase/carboxypeptidase family protein
MRVEIEATGSPAHGAHVHKGANAIDCLRVALDRLKHLETQPVDPPGSVTQAIARADIRLPVCITTAVLAAKRARGSTRCAV